MKPKTNLHVVPGSEKSLPEGAKLVGKTKAEERVEVTVLLRCRNPLPTLEQLSSPDHKALSRDEFRERHGADAADIEKVEEFANEHSLSIIQTSRSQRTMVLSGTAAAMKKAFGVTLSDYRLGRGRFRGRKGAITVPGELAEVVEGVFGLDNRPQARAHFHIASRQVRAVSPHAAGAHSFTPVEVAKLYNFPSNLNGSGQCIAILELGGGFRTTDLQKYFAALGIPKPSVTAVSVSGGHNSPTGDPNGPDGEVMLDIEVAGAVAPKAKIAVYFAPNTDAGFLNALKTAIHDNIRKPSVVSISWGGAEKHWTAQAIHAFNTACQEAAALGVTVCCSAGDHGAQDEEGETRANVDFPASSPSVLACGGTRLIEANGQIASETVWNNHDGWATGGGISERFPVPPYQATINLPNSINPGGKKGRGVPDVAGNADGQTGYRVRVDGQNTVVGGTSAVSPLWSALIALLNQGKGHGVGFLTPRLYQLSAGANALRDIISGSNQAFPPGGGYSAGPGWDACTGLGSPNGADLLAKL
jgi:kumamolisin